MDNEQLVALIRAGEDEADNMLQLWKNVERFIGMLAVKLQGYAELEDLKQEGYIGLCKAVQNYDLSAGVPFINYAAFWIKQAMRRYIDNCGGVVRIPVHERAEIQRYKKMVREYRQYYGKEPTERALCYLLEVSKEKLHSIQESARMGRIGSLSEPIGEEDDYALIDTIASDEDIEEDCIERLDAAAIKEALWEAVDLLPGNQSDVIRKRYKERRTLKETGDIIGVSTERVRQIERKAMKTLRLPNRSEKFRGYYEEYLSACSYRHVGVDTFQRTWMSEVELEVLGW